MTAMLIAGLQTAFSDWAGRTTAAYRWLGGAAQRNGNATASEGLLAAALSLSLAVAVRTATQSPRRNSSSTASTQLHSTSILDIHLLPALLSPDNFPN